MRPSVANVDANARYPIGVPLGVGAGGNWGGGNGSSLMAIAKFAMPQVFWLRAMSMYPCTPQVEPREFRMIQ
jgi:hypothetical protein